ncbi:MAG: hypothetical protein ABIR24_06465 [Verrucomicrobiota bacterium]
MSARLVGALAMREFSRITGDESPVEKRPELAALQIILLNPPEQF